MVIDKGKVTDVSPFSFKGEIIPSNHANPVRFLGRTIDLSVSDKHSVGKFVTEVLSGLKLIDKSSRKGIHKMWILQNMLIPRLRWPLLIYKISISVVSFIEHKIYSFLRKWLNIHHSMTNICLYSSTSSCRLFLMSLTSILKSTKVSGHLLKKKLLDTIKHPELAFDHLKAHLFLVEILTSREDLFLTWPVKLKKMHIKLNLYSSICRTTRLNCVIL